MGKGEEEKHEKMHKKEKNACRSSAEKALVEVKTQYASTLPVSTQIEKQPSKAKKLPSPSRGPLSPSFFHPKERRKNISPEGEHLSY